MIFLTKKKKKFIKLRILARNKGAHANFFVENTQKIGEIQPGAENNNSNYKKISQKYYFSMRVSRF